MAFDIGTGIRQRMEELNDFPIRDSMFINTGKIKSEWGFGEKFDYLATNVSGEWVVKEQVANGGLEPTPATPVDMRGKLPTRAGAPGYPTRSMNNVQLYTVHYTAGPPTQTVQQVASYQVGPTSQLPFPAIAYHLFVDGGGVLYWCHNFDRRVWGSDGTYQGQAVNDIAIHACYAGNVQPNPKQLEGLRQGRLFANSVVGRQLTVRAHSDDGATQCPGPHWAQWKVQV